MKKNAKESSTSILQAMEQIVKLSENSGLSEEFFEKAQNYISFVSGKLGLTPGEALMFSVFIDQSDDSSIRIRDIASHFRCRTISILRYASDIESLVKKKLIRCSTDRQSKSYRVPMQVVEAVKSDKPYKPKPIKGITCEELFFELENLFEQRNDNELTTDSLMSEINELFKANPQLAFVKRTGALGLPDEDRLLLVFFCHLFVRDNDDNIGFHDFDDLFDRKIIFRKKKAELERRESILLSKDLIENSGSDGLGDRSSFKLTDASKNSLLSELNISVTTDKAEKNLLQYTSLTPKQMFYNSSERKQVEQLTDLLMKDNFAMIQARLKENGMRTGFACLFHGGPGTGKTETVYQIARITGRNIMQVNVSKVKSMWVGESEKNIKSVFDRYRALAEDSCNAPILFFNEADAIIGKRQEGAERAVDKMENSIQNIILQEMENLNGILIATTNLTQNMDKAFERRFLYKIQFDKPSVQARKSIWQTMLPGISSEEAMELASSYDFSGGQIENIARKHLVGKILYGESSGGIREIIELCRNELIDKDISRKKIGF